MTTSVYGVGSMPSLLSRKSDTSVTLTGRRVAAPWKITSSILPPRSNRADCSPSPQRTASAPYAGNSPADPPPCANTGGRGPPSIRAIGSIPVPSDFDIRRPSGAWMIEWT